MKVVVNGSQRELQNGATVVDAIAAAGAEPRRGMAVAVDGEVVPRTAWAATELDEGQAIEVLEAKQGG
jgi:sulfur carrier protein